ncbi:hypothetical protein F5Y05DRAFT_292430 [Hypoxylon sp. FL0543]|nr:hypothetical protein F5Y05DRAFT_292430 [Hypoxylon sp. FL0543]
MRSLALPLALWPFILANASEKDTPVAPADTPDVLPAISPPYDFNGAIESGLLEHLTSASHMAVTLPAGKMPEHCMNVAKENGYSHSDIEAVQVWYGDCDYPWFFCRLKDSKIQPSTITEFFGKLPIGMRELVRHIIVLKPKDLHGAAATSGDDNIRISEDSWRLYILAHEISHSMDSHISIPGVTQEGQGGLSTSHAWKEQYSLDSAAVSEYARTSWAEDLAETGIIALYDRVVPGGAGTLSNESWSVYRQYATYQKYYAGILPPGVKVCCTDRLENSPMVIWDDTGSRIASQDSSPEFNTSIAIIPPGVFRNRPSCILPRVNQ